MKNQLAMRAAIGSLAFVSICSAVLPGAAHAGGVAAGTMIQNTASATYTSGTASGTVSSNTVSVRVDELLDVAVSGLTSTPAVAGATDVVLEWSVTNTGNGPEAFNIAVNPAVAGNGFDATVQQIVVDDGDGVYEPGIDQVIANGAATPAIAADGSVKIFVIVTLPGTATDGQTSQVNLTATAATGSGTPGTVFATQGNGGGDAVVGSSTATQTDNDSLIASLASVALTKDGNTIVDPFGGNQPVPGAVITYTLTATVSGTGQADSLHITDAIPAGTTYQPGTLTLDAAPLSDAADADVGQASTSGIDVNLGTVAGGTTKIVKFDVKIN